MDFQLIEGPTGKLTLRRPGEQDVDDVRIRRAFPWTHPAKFISIRGSDGKELVLIESLDALDALRRDQVVRWLDQHSFIPKITRVHEVDVRFGYQKWRVETDRGPAEFRVQEREDVRDGVTIAGTLSCHPRARRGDWQRQSFELPPVLVRYL